MRGSNGQQTLSGERGWWWHNDIEWPTTNPNQWLYLGVDYGRLSGERQPHPFNELGGVVLGLKGFKGRLRYDVILLGRPFEAPDSIKQQDYDIHFSLSWVYE